MYAGGFVLPAAQETRSADAQGWSQIATVAVTGASGLIGRALVPVLHRAGFAVRVLSRGSVGKEANGEQRVGGDLRDAAALQSLVRGADAVVHLAGVAHTDLRNAAELEAARAVNVEGTRALVAASSAAGVKRFLLISSAHVYAGQRGIDLTETSATSGTAAYAGMKLLAEEAVFAAEARMSVAVLRPCLTYGPGVRYNLSALLRALRAGYYVQVRGARTLRSLASVDTVSAAINHLLQRPDCRGCFNVADREPVELEQWTKHLASLMGARAPWELPQPVLRALAAVGSAARRFRLPAPLSTASLTKLTQPFSLNVDRLAESGFTWPATSERVLLDMIDAEFPDVAARRATHGAGKV